MKNNTKETLHIFWKYLKDHKILSFLLFISIVAASAANTIVPIYFKKFFDILSSNQYGKDTLATSLNKILLVIFLLEFARIIIWRIVDAINNRLQPSIIANLSDLCFSKLHKHSFSYFNNNFVGSLVKRVNWFTRAFENIMDQVVWSFVPLVSNLIIIIVVLGLKNIYFGLGVLSYIILFSIINWSLTKYKLKYDIKRSEAETKSTAILADTVTNNHNVKLFVGYNREILTFHNAIELVRKLRTFTWNLDMIFNGVQALLGMILELGLVYFGISMWKKNILTIGDFVMIQAYAGIIINQTWGFGRMIRNIYSSLADAEEMTVLLNTPIEIQDVPNAKELRVTSGKIEFIDVGFNYNETRQIISNLNLTIPANQKVALVGSSGSGKTTIIKLLMRMHDLTDGRILIDGQNIAEVTQESLWKNISLVPQDPILFHRTLIDNIRYSKPEATDEEVVQAAKLARCHEFISELPEKYNTYVGERGIKLSGGERQRVAIARAILRNAPILVLDEATSSLDSESEAMIQEALATLMKKKTVIVIAHRLSTIMEMDRIVVIDKGKIIEDGAHHELLKNINGTYNNLWKIQAGGFISGGEEDESEKEEISQKENTFE